MEKARSYSENLLSFFHYSKPNASKSFNGNSLFDTFLETDLIPQANIPLKFNQEWKISDHCFVCLRTFDKRKMRFEHHCRINGEPVCGQCSRRQVNKERVCDICFLKLLSKEHTKEWESVLLDKEYAIDSLVKLSEPIQGEINQLDLKLELIKNEDVKIKQCLAIHNLLEEIQKLEEKKNRILYEKELINKRVENFQGTILQKKKELDTYQNLLTMIDTENIIKREEIPPKEKTFHEMKKQQNAKAKELIKLNALDDADLPEQKKLAEHLKILQERRECYQEKEKCSIF